MVLTVIRSRGCPTFRAKRSSVVNTRSVANCLMLLKHKYRCSSFRKRVGLYFGVFPPNKHVASGLGIGFQLGAGEELLKFK